MNLSLPTTAKLHFIIGYLREAGRGAGLPAEKCRLLADKLGTDASVASIQSDLVNTLKEATDVERP